MDEATVINRRLSALDMGNRWCGPEELNGRSARRPNAYLNKDVAIRHC
jgi:hypothetical protein